MPVEVFRYHLEAAAYHLIAHVGVIGKYLQLVLQKGERLLWTQNDFDDCSNVQNDPIPIYRGKLPRFLYKSMKKTRLFWFWQELN